MFHKPKKPKCLFICKKRVDSYGISFGLLNSAAFVANALNAVGIEAKLVMVDDYNDIDREVAAYHPTHCFIEAIWVLPEKFEILCKLHSHVQFIVRIHSKTPFLALEGIAIEWILRYIAVAKKFSNLRLSANSISLNEDLINVIHVDSIFLPNIYMPVGNCECGPSSEEISYDNQPTFKDCDDIAEEDKGGVVNIGCFGAIRPLKNHLIQAMAAINFAEKIGRKLRFHINGTRLEQQGSDSIRKNLRALFSESNHELVEHGWMPHMQFIEVVKMMDIGMQVSLSESFNIVVADFIANNVPVVASPDVDWISSMSQADPNSTDDIVKKLRKAWHGRIYGLQRVNKEALRRHNVQSLKTWVNFLR